MGAGLPRIGSGQKPEVFKCDVSSTESTRECAEQILKAYPVIDVLINNAGAVFDEEKKVESGVEISFATCLCHSWVAFYIFKRT